MIIIYSELDFSSEICICIHISFQGNHNCMYSLNDLLIHETTILFVDGVLIEVGEISSTQ